MVFDSKWNGNRLVDQKQQEIAAVESCLDTLESWYKTLRKLAYDRDCFYLIAPIESYEEYWRDMTPHEMLHEEISNSD